LVAGLEVLEEDPRNHPCDTYLAYINLLLTWNKAYSLTAIDSEESMLPHHILDSLTILPHLHGVLCLDVGTGAGLSGFILALARSQLKWMLLNSNKKIRFLNQAILALRPENVKTVYSRIEDYQPGIKFSTVICMTLTSLASFRKAALPLLHENGRFLVMKGSRPEKELAELESLDLSYSIH